MSYQSRRNNYRSRESYGYSSNQTPITELLDDIGHSINLMKRIIKKVGTTDDTIDERRKL